MNPLIRKETRLLLPAWIAALVVVTMPVWPGLDWGDAKPVLLIIFGAAILGLALSPFGQEMSLGTFGLLLVQPEDRRRFWRVKTGLLAVALGSVWALFALCLWMRVWVNGDDLDMLKGSLLITLLAFSGGLWSTLLLRDIVTSLSFACVVPMAICAATLLTVGHWIDPESSRFSNILSCVLAVYLAAGFLWARRLFLGAQEVAWSGGQIPLAGVRVAPLRWLAFEIKGRQNRWTALVRKELQLQEVTMFLIPIMALLHLAALAICHFSPQWIGKEQMKEMLLGAIPCVWLGVVPLLIGCVVVAEERRLNTLDNLLCLPISKRASFAVKLAVALALGIVVGGIIPWFLLGMGGVRPGGFGLQIAVEVAAAITVVAFYASTMSRGVLQAIPTAFCVPVLIWIVIDLFSNFIFAHGYYLTIATLAWPAMILTLVWLAFKNYQQLQIGWRVWLGNLTRAGAVFGCVTLAALAIFDRPWELFQSLEPRHGPTRISGAGRASIAVSESGPCILLPDGTLWVGERGPSAKSISGRFAPGSNWVEIAAGSGGAVAIQSDGSLWRIRNTSDIGQIGSDSDWKKIAGDIYFFHALKQDGTLWIATYVTNHIATPVRVGDDSDWVDVRGRSFVKRDGSHWGWKTTPIGAHGQRFLSAGLEPDRWSMEETNWSSWAGCNPILRIRTDGSLWASGEYIPSNIFGEKVRPGKHREAVRVGTKSDWVALGGGGSPCVALEADGTLWTIKFSQSKHPSHYADWLAATEGYGGYGGTWALARDGTLCCWNEFDWHDYSTFMGKIILGPIRRPIFSCNILDEKQ
jgi:hypothetical protein